MTPPLYRACSVERCEQNVKAKGMCKKHYQRLISTGSTDARVRPERVPKHGTSDEYNRHGCRCSPCREASTALRRRTRERYPDRYVSARSDYELRNKVILAAKKQADRVANPDKYRHRAAKWAKANPERRHLAKLRRRAFEAAADRREITIRDWRRLCIRYDHCCAYCGERRPLTREHVVPLSRGGRNSIGNLLPVCGPCNYSKGNRLLTEWRRFKRATNQGKAAQSGGIR